MGGYLKEAQEDLELGGILAGERSLGREHLGVLMGRGQLGRAYARQGRLDDAETLSLETVSLIEKSRGPAHPDTLSMGYGSSRNFMKCKAKWTRLLKHADLHSKESICD